MIDISGYLSRIKNAIYGVEVRDSIHDAIKECGDLVNQCYKDATGHPESVAAVVREMSTFQEEVTQDMSTFQGELTDDINAFQEEITQTYDVERARIDEFLRGNGTSSEYTVYELTILPGCRPYIAEPPRIYSNGINAVLAISLSYMFDVENCIVLFDEIRNLCSYPEEVAPLESVLYQIATPRLYLYFDTDNNTIGLRGVGDYDPQSLPGEPNERDFRTLYIPYALKHPSISELNDLRVGADGKRYPSAGEALRSQVTNLKSRDSSIRTMVEVVRKLLDKAVFTDDITGLLGEFDNAFYEGMFRVYYTLNNVVSSNATSAVGDGEPFTTTLKADAGYKIASVTITMGGEDITESAYNDGTVYIESVTGDVVITAVSMDAGLVMLKSITGDGASYIDTEFIPDSLDYRYEFAIEADDYDYNVHSAANTDTLYVVFGVDMYNVGSAYHRMYAFLQSKTNVTFDCLGQPSTGGSWNLPTFFADNIGYCVCKNGFAQVYTDAEHSTLPNWNSTTSGVAKDESKCPIKPMYIFTVNATENSFVTEQDKLYPITKLTLYNFKIYRDSTNELLHNFVPAANGSKVGVCDTVTGKFHENKGTGTFLYEEVSA